MFCNFCGKTLDVCDEFNLGDITIPFFYGSKRDGDYLNFSLCSSCYDKLTDEFIARCKHEPKIIKETDNEVHLSNPNLELLDDYYY